MVPQHVLPLLLDLLAEGRSDDRLNIGHGDRHASAFGLKGREHMVSLPLKIGMPVHVHHVIEVAGTTALRQCSQLLCEEVNDGVTEHPVARQRGVAVLVTNRAKDRRLTNSSSLVMSNLSLGSRLGVCGPRYATSPRTVALSRRLCRIWKDLSVRTISMPDCSRIQTAILSKIGLRSAGSSGPPSMTVKSRSSEKRNVDRSRIDRCCAGRGRPPGR